MGALSHLKVLDLSRVLAGPWATQILADLGAEVIKIERPGTGDDTRAWGPPWLKDAEGADTAESAYYLSTNRNKKSVAIDMAQPEGQRLLRAMAAECDILVENFKVGGLKRYGLDYDSLRAVNPRLVYCSITGFGQTGPYAARAGYDFLIQGMGGLMSVTGRSDAEPGAGPQKVGVALTDIMTGLYATIAILAALTHRERTDHGQHIDAALLDVQIACLANQAMNYLASDKAPVRMGNAHPNIVPYQDFPTADGYMILAVGNDAQFGKLCEACAHPEWASDPRFASNAARVAHRDTLIPLLAQATRQRTTSEWIAMLETLSVPCGPISDLAAVFADPHVRHRGIRVDLPHPEAGSAPGVASPIRLSATPVEYRNAPPTLGQHTHEVLTSLLCLDEATLSDLEQRGVIERRCNQAVSVTP
jgi:crotonobetainyl-CoA:carnitine CoA-transferase CaiB-like acyl-CoA transferase